MKTLPRSCKRCRDGLPSGVSYCVACYPEPKSLAKIAPPIPLGEELRSVLRRQRRPTHATAAIGGLWSGVGILSLIVIEMFFPRAMTSWMQWLTFAVVFWFAPIWLLAGPLGRPPYQFPLSKREARTRRRRAQQRFMYVGALFMTMALGVLLALLYSQFQ